MQIIIIVALSAFHVLNIMNGYYDFFSTGLISTLKVFILCKKYEAEDGQGLGAMNSDIPWSFVKQHVLHYFTKYFSGAWVNQMANKDLNGELYCLSKLS